MKRIKLMVLLWKYLKLIFGQRGHQLLSRTQEPQGVSDQPEQVLQYDQVLKSKLTIAYALGIELLDRVLPPTPSHQIKGLDLACGPGHFSILLSQQLQMKSILGVDLSKPMVNTAIENARRNSVENVASFQQGNILDLKSLKAKSFDLSTFTDAAHHMASIEEVKNVLLEMDRVTKSEGTIFLMDLVRLKNTSITEDYIKLLSQDYLKKGLPDFLQDFRYSMYAAWTAEELRRAIPHDTERAWFHVVPRLLPTLQFIVGVPKNRKGFYLKRFDLNRRSPSFLPSEMIVEYKMARVSILNAEIQHFSAKAPLPDSEKPSTIKL